MPVASPSRVQLCGAFVVEVAVLDDAAKMVKLVSATASMKVGAEELLLSRQS